ncbi:sulfatase family protein [Vibrio sp. WXL103]|uniref:sulfatase family protein n=1 Tax=Vibrio sp. WXL103 TaxID=3450710 RepID=UPI003EC6A42B
MKLSSTKVTLSVVIALASVTPSPVLAADNLAPNIIVILADDLGYNDVGFTGETQIQTPNLDRLAYDGVIFHNGYVTHPYCGPSRAGLLTGRYQARFGMENNITYAPQDPHMGLPLSETTFVEHLQTAGYRTGMVGKWHLGGALHFQPQNRGFDYFYGFLGGGHNYFPDGVAVGHHNEYWMPMVENGKPAIFDEYLTTALSRKAAEFIQDSAGKQPFMLYVSYNAPHAPLQALEQDVAKYAHIEDRRRRIYAAMVDSMDQGVGMIIESLEQTYELDNTLIFFLSDNGGVYPEAWQPKSDWADNFPFRRGKVALLEGGVHVPFIAHWPEAIAKDTHFDGLVSALDIAATSLSIAGIDASEMKLEGKNLIPYIQGTKQGSPHNALFWRFEEGDHIWAVRTPTHKYLSQGFPKVTSKGVTDPGVQGKSLFNMVNDPYEQHDIYGQEPMVQQQLAELWNAWNADNTQTILQQSYPYKKTISNFYDSLYQERVKLAQEREPYFID